MSKDYYETLGVSRDATEDEIASAYKKMAMKYHPDRQQGKTDAEKKEAEEKFKECAEAADVLKDPEKRKRYDQFGAADDEGFGGFGGSGGFDPMEFFRNMHPGFGFGGGFNGFGFGFGGPERNSPPDMDSPEDGADVQTKMGITFKESVFGCVKEFDLDLDRECPSCGGSGAAKGSKPAKCRTCGGTGRKVEVQRRGVMVMQNITQCPDCGGSGWSCEKCPECGGAGIRPEKRHVKVKVPAGFENGNRLRLKGLGRCGLKGGRNGDLYVSVSVRQSPLFARDGLDVAVRLYVSPATASLGGTAEVPTPYGYRKIKIAPGTASGTRMKVSGGGIRPESGKAGDMIVIVEIEPYSSQTDEQRELLKRLQASESLSNFEKASKEKAVADAFYAE